MHLSNKVNLSSGMVAASASFNLKLSESSYTLMRLGDKIYEASLVDGFENIPPKDYNMGVDFAVVRMSTKDGALKDGYYRARLKSESPIENVGKATLLVQLIDLNGNVSFENQTTGDVFSVELPKLSEKSSPIFQFSAANKDGSMIVRTPSDFGDTEIQGVVCCSNGMCGICIGPACPK